MKRIDELEQQQKRQQENRKQIAIAQTHQLKDIKPLLLPWFSFRLYMVFNPPAKSKRHFYGNEHQVTYNQCMHGKVKNIVLRKSKGYYDLIRLVEKTFKGKYQSATIYMRTPGSTEFDVECRRYFKGELQIHQDPLLSDDEGFTLYFFIKEGRIEVSETDPQAIDFRKEIENATI